MNLKNAWAPLKLMLSAFHPLHVAHINFSNNMTRGINEALSSGQQGALRRMVAIPEAVIQNVTDPFLALPIGTPHRGKAAREAWTTPYRDQTPDQKAITNLMIEGGFSPQLSEQLRIAAKRNLSDSMHNIGQMWKIPWHLGRRIIEFMQAGIFEHWIPNLKAAAYLREAETLFNRRPELLNNTQDRMLALRAIGKQVDNRFGEMFYGGLFWNRMIKDASIGSFLSLGWNLGFAREFVGGALEPFARRLVDKPTPSRAIIRDATSKTSNMFIYTMSAMMVNGLMNYAMTGEMPEGYDYIFPRWGGNNPDGSPRRITNMFYTREVPMVKKNIEERDSVIDGIKQTLYHKMMFSPVVEGYNNKNYFGYQIYDPNAPGLKQIQQFANHMWSEQLNPMSIAGAERSLQLSGKPYGKLDILKQIGDPDVYMPLLGFPQAPAYVSKTPIQNYIGGLYSDHVQASGKPYAEGVNFKERKAARDAYLIAKQTNDTAKMAEAVQRMRELQMPLKNLGKMRPGTQDIFMFGKLQPDDQKNVLKRASKEEFQRYYRAAKAKTKMDKEIGNLWSHYYGQ
jgi:hypothetical protein